MQKHHSVNLFFLHQRKMFDEGNLKLKMAKHFLGRRKKRKSDENDSSCYTLLLLYVGKLCVCTNGLLLVNSKCFLAGIICSVKFFYGNDCNGRNVWPLEFELRASNLILSICCFLNLISGIRTD